MKLDLSSFEKALSSLERGILRSEQNRIDEELRDAVIQRFEYTYELAWKMTKRQIEQDSASPAEVDAYSFKDLMRVAHERALIDDPVVWFGYRDARNKTSHGYDEENAKVVYKAALEFLPVAKRLLRILGERNK